MLSRPLSLDNTWDATYRVPVFSEPACGGGSRMTFDEILTQVLGLLRREGRELGLFVEGRPSGEEGLRIAEAVEHSGSLMVASWGAGVLSLRHGDLPRALLLLERAVSICQDPDLSVWFTRIAPYLGMAYALT